MDSNIKTIIESDLSRMYSPQSMAIRYGEGNRVNIWSHGNHGMM